jgi:protein gp37
VANLKTTIEWTDVTWSPTIGCTRVSAGCDHCYAFRLHDKRHLAWKRGTWPQAPAQYHQPFSRVQLFPDRLTQPLHWRTPRRVFVDSMSDLFHDDVPDDYLDQVFAVMAHANRHTYQILTKRPERMRSYVQGASERVRAKANWNPHIWSWPLGSVHLGVSVEDQDAADTRIPWLLQTPAAVRFLSCEPLLGPVDLGLCCICTGSPGICSEHQTPYDIGWVIVGGESGPRARPMHPDWARSLRDQCAATGVPFLFKQWGEWVPLGHPAVPKHEVTDAWMEASVRVLDDDGRTARWTEGHPDDGSKWSANVDFVVRVGKHAAGRLLDGRTWDEMPEARHAR